MPNVFFGQVVMGQIQGFEAVVVQVLSNLLALQGLGGGESHKNMRHSGVAHAVVEFGHLS